VNGALQLSPTLKNWIHATLAKYSITTAEHNHIFTGAAGAWLETTLHLFPPKTVGCVTRELETLKGLQD
jgi:hypothetical protein